MSDFRTKIGIARCRGKLSLLTCDFALNDFLQNAVSAQIQHLVILFADSFSATKAGVIGFTKTLARESASKGITVNAIAPSMVKTEMMLAIPPAKLEAVLNAHPMHRMGEPSEVAALAAYLCSEDCSYVTGTVINCAGAECTSS